MTRDVRYHPEALAELRADVAWYEGRDTELGDCLEATVDDVIETILEWPDSGAIWPEWNSIPVARSRRVTGFPYRLVYVSQASELVVIALAHDKRLPGYWRERASE